MSAKDALNRYYKRQMGRDKRDQKPKRKNAKPEKFLEKEVLAWASSKAIHLHVVEAKAVYSQSAGRYLRGQAEAGLPDLIGNIEGLSVWIELKAKGRRSTLKPHQQAFLIAKIEQGCFAACIDSVDQLESLLSTYFKTAFSDRAKLLLDHLPKKKSGLENAEDELFS